MRYMFWCSWNLVSLRVWSEIGQKIRPSVLGVTVVIWQCWCIKDSCDKYRFQTGEVAFPACDAIPPGPAWWQEAPCFWYHSLIMLERRRKKATGWSLGLSPNLCDNTVSTSTMKGLEGSGCFRIVTEVNALLRCSNAWLAESFQWSFFGRFLISDVRSAAMELKSLMNHL